MNKPTDAEIAECVHDAKVRFVHADADTTIEIARAVLSKWGQPAHSGEPLIPFRHGCKWCGKTTACAHTQPQPVEREPLSPEQRTTAFIRAEKKMQSNINLSWRNALVDEIEAAHGIKVG